MKKSVITEETLPPTSLWRMHIAPKDELVLIKTIIEITKSKEIKKDKNAYEKLLKLGGKISKSKRWEAKGKEVELFLKERKAVM